ncbi:hypothetical protein EIP86_008785 [Pleurotus ostreatoroseus]|nr:hypothetical protein EIP86_008785 [Pleurotus ostreatoroseus]
MSEDTFEKSSIASSRSSTVSEPEPTPAIIVRGILDGMLDDAWSLGFLLLRELGDSHNPSSGQQKLYELAAHSLKGYVYAELLPLDVIDETDTSRICQSFMPLALEATPSNTDVCKYGPQKRKAIAYSDTETSYQPEGNEQHDAETQCEDEVEFNEKHVIGAGSSGKVYCSKWDGAIVAVKRIDAAHGPEVTAKLIQEARTWSKLRHPNILFFYDAYFAEDQPPYIIMEYCCFGDIRKYLCNHPDADRVALAYDISVGLAFLHKRGVVHADIKATNVLVTDHKNPRAVICDFGSAIKNRGILSSSPSGSRSVHYWQAPEILDGGSTNAASDVYSLGLTIWEIFSERLPFDDIIEAEQLCEQVVKHNKRPNRPPRLTKDLVWEQIEACWAAKPQDRPRASQVGKRLQSLTVNRTINIDNAETPTQTPSRSKWLSLKPSPAVTD